MMQSPQDPNRSFEKFRSPGATEPRPAASPTIAGLRDRMDSSTGKTYLNIPLFSDVLRRHAVRIKRACIVEKAQRH
jgi:hypothetical protein